MKRKKIMVVSILLLLLICVLALLLLNRDEEKRMEFYCGPGNDVMYDFYEDSKYIYYYGSSGYYIFYGNERMPFDKAISRGLITLEDIDREIERNPSCQYDKRPLGSDY